VGQASSGVGRGMAVALKAGGAANAREWTQMGGLVRGVSLEVLRGTVVGLEGGVIRRSTQIYADSGDRGGWRRGQMNGWAVRPGRRISREDAKNGIG